MRHMEHPNFEWFETQHLKFFKGVRADLQKRYTLQNHIGRGACAPLPSPSAA